MVMKNRFIILFFAIFAAFGCNKNNINSDSMVEGEWILTDDNSQTSVFIRFKDGFYTEFSSQKGKLQVEEGVIYNCSESDFKPANPQRYSIKDGNLYLEGKSAGEIDITNGILTISGRTYEKLISFKARQYSSIECNGGKVYVTSFASGSREVPCTIKNPSKSARLSGGTSDKWISDISFSKNTMIFNLSETDEDRSGSITIHYSTADDVTLIVEQHPDREIRPESTEITIESSQKSAVIPYAIVNPKADASVMAKSDSDWITRFNINSSEIEIEVQENQSDSPREASVILTYPEAKPVSITIRQQSMVHVTSVSLDQSALNLAKGDVKQLVASVLPENAANKSLKWESSKPDVATVSDNGQVKAISSGSAIIKVSSMDGNHQATCTVTVTVPVSSISLNKTSLNLAVNATYKLIATINPSDASNKEVTWETSDPTIATVSDGMVSSIKAGAVTISVTTRDGNKTATCTVTIKQQNEDFTEGDLF